MSRSPSNQALGTPPRRKIVITYYAIRSAFLRLGKTILIGIAQKAGGCWPHEIKAGDAVSPMTGPEPSGAVTVMAAQKTLRFERTMRHPIVGDDVGRLQLFLL